MSLSARWVLLPWMVLVAALDQWTKWVAVHQLDPEHPVLVIPGLLRWQLSYNTGAAFSLLREAPQMLTLLTSGIFLLLLGYAISRRVLSRTELIGLSLILGGALGNLIDRFRLGRVVDFIDVYVIHYPVFNLADSFIFCGVLLLLVWHLRSAPPEPGDGPRP